MTGWKPSVGEAVVALQYSPAGQTITERSEVTKIGKRDIVLANGSRYRVSDLERQGVSDPWRGRPTLHSWADPAVAAAVARQRLSRAYSSVLAAYDKFRVSKSSEDAQALADAASAYGRLMSEVAA